tara:strand:+ start:528 stop:2372 length:1845 start_codon:yes stop_codon:yes gene_type:complete
MAINFPNTPGNGSQHTASGITWTYDGTTWKADGITSSYTLPTASSTVLGGVKVGSGLSISSGSLSMTGVQYTDTTALNAVSTSTHHGLFALLNSDGHGYFARGGTVNVAVTVGVDNVNGQATGVFYFGGVEKPAFYPINRGVTFIFDQSDTTNATYNSQAHPLMFSTGSDGDHNGNGHYMTGVQYKLDGVNKTMAEYVSGFAAATTRTAEFTVAANAPDTLYYWCHSHTGQGNSIQVNQGPWVQLLDKSSSIGELRNVDTTAPSNGQVLKWVSASNHWAPANETGGSSYANSDVDAHINLSSANVNEVLSWNGSDYDWVANSGGGGTTLTIQDEGSALAVAATTLNFVGAGVVASGSGAVKTITIGTAATAPPTISWTFTAPTSAHYVFTGDGFVTGTNDPTLYLIRGQTYKFVNNTGTQHPFRIQTDGPTQGGGTQYNDGVTNNDADNGVTLTFVVPMDAPDTLYYQCTLHTEMFGTINILSQGGSGLQSRQSFNQATSSIADGATDNITITAYKTYSLLSIQTSAAAWVTLYTDQASRTADSGRNETTDPLPGSGVIAEVITTAAQTQIITPATIGWNNEATPVAAVYAKVVNKSGGTAAITVTITAVQLEG